MHKVLKIVLPLLIVALLIARYYPVNITVTSGFNLAAVHFVTLSAAGLFTVLLTLIAFRRCKQKLVLYALLATSIILLIAIHFQWADRLFLWKIELVVLLLFSAFSLSTTLVNASKTIKILLYTTVLLLAIPLLTGQSHWFIGALGALLCAITTVWTVAALIRSKD